MSDFERLDNLPHAMYATMSLVGPDPNLTPSLVPEIKG